MRLTGTFGNKEIVVEYNGEGQPCHLHVRFLPPIDMEIDRGEFKNPRGLSAQLRSELSYQDCCAFLFENNVPKESGLWSLNHDGYPSDHFIATFFSK